MIDFEKLEKMLDEALDKETKESLEDFMKDNKPKFVVECFIRKNTPELRNKLNELGYHICSCTEFEDAKWLETFLQTDHPSVHGIGYWDETCPFEPHQALDFFVKENATSEIPAIDCDENEDLFLTLAALRDDNNYMQWFTDGENWFQNKQNDIEVINCKVGNPINFHKATAEEIIKAYKDKLFSLV